jgi:hypothetical protein
MRRQDYTRAALVVSLACMTLFVGYGVGAEPLQASSSRSQEAETLQIVGASKVTLQYVATVPCSTTAPSASLFRVGMRFSKLWNKM